MWLVAVRKGEGTGYGRCLCVTLSISVCERPRPFLIHNPPTHTPSPPKKVTLDGLHFGGNYTAAQEMVREGRAVSSRFRFFIQQTVWAPGELRAEVEDAKVRLCLVK